MKTETRRIAVVSNRLPVVLTRNDRGRIRIKPGSGGLVTAVGPVLKDKGGLWIGWPGSADIKNSQKYLDKICADAGYGLKAVELTEDEIRKYYYGYSNSVLWPLFHDLPSRCNFDPDFWPVYEQVNRKFAEKIVEVTEKTDYVWIQDYQLCLVASQLKKLRENRKTGFFLHILFPSMDIFLKLPQRLEILKALLEFDIIGFQTGRDRQNFIKCVKTLIPGSRTSGRSNVIDMTTSDRKLRVGSFPISIDFNDFADRAKSREIAEQAWYTHEKLPGRKLVLGVDRLDYSKGIPERIRAVDKALELYPELRENITFIQIVVPSRTEVEEYQILKAEIERLVGEINGKYTAPGWTPIHYIFGSQTPTQLLAYYRTCEIALITPLKDGMNLVAKEYCASSIEEDGVLILSEFAGAATQLGNGALLVNPFDTIGVASAIHTAFKMQKSEKRSRMRSMRRSIRRNDIHKWVDNFLEASIARKLKDISQDNEMYVEKAWG